MFTKTEKPFIEDPLLAPSCICCGAAAFADIKKCKPLTPQQPSRITDLIVPYQDQQIALIGENFTIVILPGHTRGMIAVRSPDNVLYCGDAVFGEETFRKYPVLYYSYIGDTLASLKKLKEIAPTLDGAVLYHGGSVSDLQRICNEHESALLAIKESIYQLISATPLSVEEITAWMMTKYQIPDELISYALTKVPMQAYVAQLELEGKVRIKVTAGVARAHLQPAIIDSN